MLIFSRRFESQFLHKECCLTDIEIISSNVVIYEENLLAEKVRENDQRTVDVHLNQREYLSSFLLPCWIVRRASLP